MTTLILCLYVHIVYTCKSLKHFCQVKFEIHIQNLILDFYYFLSFLSWGQLYLCVFLSHKLTGCGRTGDRGKLVPRLAGEVTRTALETAPTRNRSTGVRTVSATPRTRLRRVIPTRAQVRQNMSRNIYNPCMSILVQYVKNLILCVSESKYTM